MSTTSAGPPGCRRLLDHEILVIGAGFSGIGAGIKLKQAGFEDFVILEQAADLGGTWRDNTYPGVAVDVASFSYSFSFAQNPRWSRVFAPGREIKQYADRCADDYGLRERMRFDTKVIRAAFDEAAQAWRVDTSAGRMTARYLITACGVLTQPKRPDIEGLDDFEGKLMHTARWDHAYDLRGKRTAVIGTGPSAVQLVPAIAEGVRKLHVFQRTPAWVLPKPDREIPSWLSTLFQAAPATQAGLRLLTSALTELIMVMGAICQRQVPGLASRIETLCLRHLERQVKDPELRAKLTPRYRFGCKRPSASNDYFPALARENVELVTEPIDRITRTGIRTSDGVTRAVDALILATGFKGFEVGNTPPFEVYGRGGQELGRFWFEHRYQAYEGATVPAFPNLFMVCGPYGATASSWFTMVEAQATHATRCLSEARRRSAKTVEIRQEPHDAFFRDVLRRRKNSVFLNNCSAANSTYFDRHGDVPFLRPSSGLELWWRSRHFNLDHYCFT
jgi:cation diffusion facilitator CzcD-associated flavoprotein CzcO